MAVAWGRAHRSSYHCSSTRAPLFLYSATTSSQLRSARVLSVVLARDADADDAGCVDVFVVRGVLVTIKEEGTCTTSGNVRAVPPAMPAIGGIGERSEKGRALLSCACVGDVRITSACVGAGA